MTYNRNLMIYNQLRVRDSGKMTWYREPEALVDRRVRMKVKDWKRSGRRNTVKRFDNFYEGTVTSYDPRDGTHEIKYDEPVPNEQSLRGLRK